MFHEFENGDIEDIEAFQAVRLRSNNTIESLNPAISSHRNTFVGIATEKIAKGAKGKIQLDGIVINPDWKFPSPKEKQDNNINYWVSPTPNSYIDNATYFGSTFLPIGKIYSPTAIKILYIPDDLHAAIGSVYPFHSLVQKTAVKQPSKNSFLTIKFKDQITYKLSEIGGDPQNTTRYCQLSFFNGGTIAISTLFYSFDGTDPYDFQDKKSSASAAALSMRDKEIDLFLDTRGIIDFKFTSVLKDNPPNDDNTVIYVSILFYAEYPY